MKRFIKYSILTLAVLIIIAGGLFAYVLYTTGGEGTSFIEEWVGSQVKGAVQEHLNVKIDFEKPDYQYPKTVVLENVRLTANDPSNPGMTIDILTIRKAKMTLAEIPEKGQPLHIENVILDEPVLRFIATKEGASSFVGFSNLIRGSEGPEPERDPSAPPPKITDVFRIRLIQLNDGRIVYNPRQGDKRAMDLDQINCKLDVQPDTEGWYKLKTTLGRVPVFGLDIDGRFNINESIIELASLNLRANLGQESNRSLPPQLQTFLAEHAVEGRLTVNGKGMLKLNDLADSDLTASLELDGGNLSVDDYLFHVATLNIDASLSGRNLTLSRFDMRALGGSLNATGQLALNDSLDAQLTMKGKDLHIERLLKMKTADPKATSEAGPAQAPAEDEAQATNSPPIRPEFGEEPPRKATRPDTSTTSTSPSANAEAVPFAGKLTFDLDLRAPLSQYASQLYGTGRIELTEGRISSLPVISDLEEAIAVASNLIVGKRNDGKTESMLLLFEMQGDHADLKKIDYRSTLIAARGVGTVAFADGGLDMKLNGGPIEKIQSMLGKVGEWTAVVTDRLVGYEVTGTTDEPNVRVVVAGGILDKIGNFFNGK